MALEREGFSPFPGCDGTNLVLGLQADTMLRPHVIFPVMRQEVYISETTISNRALFRTTCKVIENMRMPQSFY